jgi:hypothetical protein
VVPDCQSTFKKRKDAAHKLCKQHNRERIYGTLKRIDGVWQPVVPSVAVASQSTATSSTLPPPPTQAPVQSMHSAISQDTLNDNNNKNNNKVNIVSSNNPSNLQYSRRRRFSDPTRTARPLSASAINKKARAVLEYAAPLGNKSEQSIIISTALSRLPDLLPPPLSAVSAPSSERRGRKRKLADYEDLEFVGSHLAGNLSIEHVLVLLNADRSAVSLPLLSMSTLRRFIARQPAILPVPRGIKKSGNDDENSQWARARLALCQQFCA